MRSVHEKDLPGSPTGTADSLAAIGSPQRSELSRAWSRFKSYRPGVAGLIFILLLTILALVPGLFAPYSPIDGDTSMRGASPSWEHPLGNDEIGRDILSRVIYGTRIALLVGLLATLVSVAIGVAAGIAAGFFGGWTDSVLSRLTDSLMAFPTLVLLVALVAIVGPGLETTILVIGGTLWAPYARVTRADVLSLREQDFITAARAIGATDRRILARYLLPNVLSPVIILASLSVGGIIILASALSFLGLGVQPPTADWGNMLAAGRGYVMTYPHIAIAPGIMISLTVLAFNLIGDGLRDALDPRQQE